MTAELHRIGPLEIPIRRLGDVGTDGALSSASNDALDSETVTKSISEGAITLNFGVGGKRRSGSVRTVELIELLRSVKQAPVTVDFRASDGAGLNGYYAADQRVNRSVQLSKPDDSEDVESVSVGLTRVGTRSRHFRAVETAPDQPESGHDFGNDLTALVGIPAAAEKLVVIDTVPDPTERVVPEPVATHITEFGGVEIFDAAAIGFDDPIFLYDIAYGEGPKTDVKVYDPLGQTEKYVESDDGRVRQWQHVFDRGHDPVAGEFVVDNGILRIHLDESAGEIGVEYYSDGSYASGLYSVGTYGGAEEWQTLTLTDVEWSLRDANLTHVAPARVEAQLEFMHDTDGELYAVDVVLGRGRTVLEVWIPESVSDPIPEGLAELFEPIASESVYTAESRQTLVSRDEVKR